MKATVKAAITVDGKVATFEGSAEFVDAPIAEHMDVNGSSDNRRYTGVQPHSAAVGVSSALSERRLVLAKRPQGHSETVAVLAFALAQTGLSEFTEDDIRNAYIRAGVKPPKVVGQAIRDAKNVFDYVDTGSKRGKYKLTHHGDRTVRFDLPRQSVRG